MKVVTSRDFNQDVSQAKRFARVEPVFVTDRGKPTHVLMSIAAFRQLTGATESVVDMLAMPGSAPTDLDRSISGENWDRRADLG